MKQKLKIILSIIIMLLLMLIIPLLIINLTEPDKGMNYILICFFGVYPVMSLVLGIIAGTEVKKLWWIPILTALFFPLTYWFLFKGIIIEFFIYAGIYLLAGLIAMGFTALIVKKIEKQKN